MARLIFAKLANSEHVMPHPHRAGMFPAEGLPIDAENPDWMQLLADGSLVEAEAPAQPDSENEEPGKAKRKEK